ncbi:MAG: hypothetical protein AAF998_24340 [Bacteroidota bacterium]
MSEKLAHYSFLPYVRLGLSATIQETDHLGLGISSTKERVSVTVEARVNGTRYGELSKRVLLVGPGDITGIQSKAIVRSFPRNGTRNFEPNYLPFVEFYEEDFLWRYTPARANGDKLRPWLHLLILKDGEFERETALSGPLPSLKLTGQGLPLAFPDPGESWAWAHVHVHEDLDPDDKGSVAAAVANLNDAVTANPNSACCRLLSTRRLEPQTRYTAFLVPAFETGRRAGLGEATDTTEAQKASYGGTDPASRYPFYYSFAFQTGERGDFETLVEELVPRVMDHDVGRQPMDIQDPGYEVSYTSGDGTVMLEGALRTPDRESTVPLSFTGASALADELKSVLDLEKTLTSESHSAGGTRSHKAADPLLHEVFGVAHPSHSDRDPVIMPPLYGRWHAQVEAVDDPLPADLTKLNWLNQLNLDPTLRAAAGLGAEVVRKNQEAYMDRCWEQIGEVLEANRRLRQAQLAKEAGGALYRKHLKDQSDERILSLASRYQSRVLQDSETVWQKTVESALPVAAQSDAFRRIVRPSGPVMKRIQPSSALSEHTDLIGGLARKTYTVPVESRDLSQQNTFSRSRTRYLFYYTGSRTVSSTNRFALTEPGETRLVSSNQEGLNFKSAASPFYGYLDTSRWMAAPALPSLNVGNSADALRAKLNPELAILTRIPSEIQLGNAPLVVGTRIETIMACPKLFTPAYEDLVKLSAEYMLPNLELIPDDTLSLLEVNPPFIESFLAGMNHEMMRELLWREFPTDQRGTVFQYFWDGTDFSGEGMTEAERQTKLQDIKEMHQWSSSAQIGENGPQGANSSEAKLVLVIRGELLRRYPNTMIYATKAKWQTVEREIGGRMRNVIDRSLPRELTETVKMPLFTAQIKPDITLIGFDLTAEEAHGMRKSGSRWRKFRPGWFFVLEERAGEIRFGLDEPESQPSRAPASYQELNWGHVDTGSGHVDLGSADNLTKVSGEPVKWGRNAANMAYILYQDPVRVAVHAADMIEYKN